MTGSITPSKAPVKKSKVPGYAVLVLLIGAVVVSFVWYLNHRDAGEPLPRQMVMAQDAVLAPLAASPSQAASEPAKSLGNAGDAVFQHFVLEHLAFDGLVRRIKSGQPYEVELGILFGLFSDPTLKSEALFLKQYAATGVPALDQVKEDAQGILEKFTDADEATASTMVAQVFRSVVSVRKKSSRQSQFLGALDRNDLKAAIVLGQGLQEEGYPLGDVLKRLQVLGSFFGQLQVLQNMYHDYALRSLKPYLRTGAKT